MRGFTTLKIIIGLFFIIAIIVAVYFFTADRAKAPVQNEMENLSGTTTTATSSELPEGVSVREENGKRMLRDERVGYEMEIPEDLRLKTEDERILFYDVNAPLIPAGAINIFENSKNLSLENWLEEYNKQERFLYYNERKKIKIGDQNVYRLRVEGAELEYYDYYLLQDGKILVITTPYSNFFDKYLDSIKFFK